MRIEVMTEAGLALEDAMPFGLPCHGEMLGLVGVDARGVDRYAFHQLVSQQPVQRLAGLA